MKYVDLIIFDLDGTLVDSREDIANAVNHTLRKVGLKEKSLSEITSYIGTGMRDLIRKSLGEECGLFDKSLSIFEDYYRRHCAECSVLYQGVKEILEHFKDKRKAIVTNRNYKFALLILKALGIYDYFQDIIGGDDIGCMKPSYCPLDSLMQRFNIDREKTIIVGDMHIDILAGKRAGIITCAVTYGIGRKEDIVKAKPDYIIDNILKLKEIIS